MSDPDVLLEPNEEETSRPDDTAMVRELILASHTDLVSELVRGSSIPELIASIAPAKAAFSRVVNKAPKAVSIPAGGNPPLTIDANALPASEKIRRGLAASKRKA